MSRSCLSSNLLPGRLFHESAGLQEVIWPIAIPALRSPINQVRFAGTLPFTLAYCHRSGWAMQLKPALGGLPGS